MSTEDEDRIRKKRELLIRLLREKRLRERGDNFLRNPDRFLNPRRNRQSSAASPTPQSAADTANPRPDGAGIPTGGSRSRADISRSEVETSPSSPPFVVETPETPIDPGDDVTEHSDPPEAPPRSTEPSEPFTSPEPTPKILPLPPSDTDDTDVVYGVQTPSGGIITSDFLFGDDEVSEPELEEECRLRLRESETETETETEPSPDDALDGSDEDDEWFGEEMGLGLELSEGEEESGGSEVVVLSRGGGGGSGEGGGESSSSSSRSSKRKRLKVSNVRALGWLLLPGVLAALVSLLLQWHGMLILLTFFVMRRWANQYFELKGKRQAADEIRDQISVDSSLPIWTHFANLALKLLFEGKLISLHLAGYVVTFVVLSVLFGVV